MKKYYYWSLLTFVMVAMLSVSFASCGNDDDEDGSSAGDNGLVGTWVQYHRSGAYYSGFKFTGSGAAYYNEWDSDEDATFGSKAGKWIAADNVLTVSEPNGNTYVFSYSLSEDGQTLRLSGGSSAMSGNYTRQ